MSRSNANPGAHTLAQALLRLPPDEINTVVRPISPEMADILLDRQQAHARVMAERMVEETLSQVNRERTRLLIKDQLRQLIFGNDRDIAKLAAAEFLTREPASNRTLAHANGDVADIGYDSDGEVYVHVHRVSNATGHSLPATGEA